MIPQGRDGNQSIFANDVTIQLTPEPKGEKM